MQGVAAAAIAPPCCGALVPSARFTSARASLTPSTQLRFSACRVPRAAAAAASASSSGGRLPQQLQQQRKHSASPPAGLRSAPPTEPFAPYAVAPFARSNAATAALLAVVAAAAAASGAAGPAPGGDEVKAAEAAAAAAAPSIPAPAAAEESSGSWWDTWKARSQGLKEKVAKLGLAAVLAYGLFDGITYTTFFVLAFLGYEKSTGLNPAANLKALLGIVVLMWTGNNVTRPFRVAGAAAVAPFLDEALKKFQKKLNLPSQFLAFVLVAGTFGAICLSVVGLLILSRIGG
ncbi:hypothetical protein CLOM_g23527 [Closterium sp. NIES-68]|nr:hypothetical protein CLOM_g23527 [Closterium sp. NIES-68]GJP77962.1 hypothetical protein CLOP_g8282 [Closterium sp. NIES-67]